MELSRRSLLKLVSATATGLTIGGMVSLPAGAEGEAFDPTFFIELLPSGKIRVKITRSELGQGVQTGFTQIVADELGANWDDMEGVIWHYDKENGQKLGDYYGAGGSQSIRMLWTPLRTAAAALREMLANVAATGWSVPVAECSAENSYVHHKASNRSAAFRDLFAKVKDERIPNEPRLKDVSDYTFIGKEKPSLDNEEIATGKLTFSIDENLPNMLTAVIERPPVFGAKLIRFDASKALAVNDVTEVFALDNIEQTGGDPIQDWQTNYRGIEGGVVVVASSTWAAIKGREALEIEWDEGANAQRNSVSILAELKASTAAQGTTRREIGDVDSVFASAPKVYEQHYENPFQATTSLEPLNAVADVREGKCTLWAGTQAPDVTAIYVSELLNMNADNVTVHVRKSGGGFGRRFCYDFAAEAALVSNKVGLPIKLLWTREDDIRFTRAHPARVEKHKIALDENNLPLAYESVAALANGDPFGVYGLFNPYSYGCEHIKDRYVNEVERLIHVGSWRSVSAHWQTFARECLIDEVISDIGGEPIEQRLKWLDTPVRLISDPDRAAGAEAGRVRARHVLRRAAELSGWTQKRAEGKHLGVSLDRYGNTWVAQVVELEGTASEPKIKKITCVFDCGIVVNPQLVKGQIEGSLVWALQPIMFDPIIVERGRVIQSNFDTYEMPRMSDLPEIHIELVDSDMSPSGAGEPAVPGLAPAVMNAYFSMSGERKRSLPLVA